MISFDDLIDVAVQALKDNVLESVILNNLGVRSLKYCTSQDADSTIVFDQYSDYSESFEYIKSLYTETFVIESIEDMKRVKINSKGVLPNGLVFTITDMARKMFNDANSIAITVNFEGNEYNELLYLSPLKGAKVTQKREV